MTESELISQLKTLRSINPDEKWVNLTRTRIILKGGIFGIFNFAIPKPVAISAMAMAVAVVGGFNIYSAGFMDTEIGSSPALTASLRHVLAETAEEVAEVQQIAHETVNPPKNNQNSAHTVVFNQEAEEHENFQALLRERIEKKIAYVKDLFAQVEDGERVREIMQNPRRYEENFKIFGEGLEEQVSALLTDAEKALAEGDLITALDLINAIDKLIKS